VIVGPRSAVAIAALLLYPAVVLLAFGLSRARPAVLVTLLLLGGRLLLPSGIAIDLPGLPKLSRNEIINLSLFLGLLATRPRLVAAARPGRGIEILALAIAVSGVGTVLTNRDPLFYGGTSLPPLSPWDLPTAFVRDLVRFALPVFMGRCVMQNARDLRSLLTLLAGAGLLYSLPILVELRLSPMFHYWTYGYHGQLPFLIWRFGGYRPAVYMTGLNLAVFMATALLSAVALARARLPLRTPLFPISSAVASVYLLCVFVACKSLGAILLALPLALALALLPVRALNALAVALTALVLAYPLLRAYDALPVEGILSLFEGLSKQRAQSLGGRFESETLMLAKARERLLFGWGTSQRFWVFDPETGKELMAPDGFWIVTLGAWGFMGFVTTFGIFTLPVFLVAKRLARIPADANLLALGLMLSVVLLTFDYLPNGFWGVVHPYLAGALYGVQRVLPARGVSAPRASAARSPAPPMRDRGP
jgi:hypothetical protein